MSKKNNDLVLEKADADLHIRLTPSQKKRFLLKAEKAGISITELTISSLDNLEVRERISDDSKNTLMMLAKNLNQLLKFAHQGNFSEKAILDIMQKIKEVLYNGKYDDLKLIENLSEEKVNDLSLLVSQLSKLVSVKPLRDFSKKSFFEVMQKMKRVLID